MICITGCKECIGCMACQDEKIYCSYCEECIDDYYYEIHGYNVCKQCLEDLYRKEVD